MHKIPIEILYISPIKSAKRRKMYLITYKAETPTKIFLLSIPQYFKRKAKMNKSIMITIHIISHKYLLCFLPFLKKMFQNVLQETRKCTVPFNIFFFMFTKALIDFLEFPSSRALLLRMLCVLLRELFRSC